jgi:hypothetical protein
VTLSPGTAVRVVMTKWGGRPHWEFATTFLGSDDAGDWLGIPAGTRMVRPGAEYVAPVDQVGLVPAPGLDEGRWWLATFHGPGGEVHTYVDVTAPPLWDGREVRAVDLDLDVVRDLTDRVWVDDEEEFLEHQRTFGYPSEVVEQAEASATRILAAVTERWHPFDGTADAWLARLVDLPPE